MSAVHEPASDEPARVEPIHDPEDPLGVAELLARLGEPPAATLPGDADLAALTAPAAEGRDDREYGQAPLDLGADLAEVAVMAREVEDARFAAETELYAQLQAAAEQAALDPSPPDPDSDDSDSRSAEVDLQADSVTATRSAVTLIPDDLDGPDLDDWHHELAAIVAASAAQLAEAGNAAAPLIVDPGSIPVDPPAPDRPPAPPVPLAASMTDTAALLRELASLSGEDRDAPGDPPAGRTPSPGRTAPAAVPRSRRKGLFGR